MRGVFACLAVALLIVSGLPTIAPANAQDGGSWEAQTLSFNAQLNGVDFPSLTHGWVVGDNGQIHATTDGGTTWAQQSSGTASTLHDVTFLSESTGWVAGAGILLHTTDAGSTWTPVDTGENDATFWSVHFVDEGHGWLSGFTSTFGNLITHTNDGGETWTRQLTGESIGIMELSFANTENGLAVSHLHGNYRTTNGGDTWTQMVISDEATTTSVTHITPDLAIAGSLEAIHRTTDAGITWSEIATFDESINSIAASENIVVAVGDNGLITRSTDFGETFTVEAGGTSRDLESVSAPSPLFQGAVGSGGVYTAFSATISPRLPLTIDLFQELYTEMEPEWVKQGRGDAFAPRIVDLTGDGNQEIIYLAPQGVFAIQPFEPTEKAVLWHLPFQARISDMEPMTLDEDGRIGLAIGTTHSGDTRSGVFVLDGATGQVEWDRRVSGDGVARLQTGDFTGDGVDDVLVASNGDAIQTFRGIDGDALTQPRPMGDQITDLRLGNLSSTNGLEAVVTLQDGFVEAFHPLTGNVLWQDEEDVETAEAVAIGDLTGNGFDDVVYVGRGEAESLMDRSPDNTNAIGPTTGPFVRAVVGETGTRIWDYSFPRAGSASFSAVRLGDVTGNGELDVIAHHARIGSGQLVAMDGRGDPGTGSLTGEPLFLWRADTTHSDGGQHPYTNEGLVVGDGDGDGHADAYLGIWAGALQAFSGQHDAPPTTRPDEAPRTDPLWKSVRDTIMRQPNIYTTTQESYILQISADSLLSLNDPATGERVWAYDGGNRAQIAAGDFTGDGRDDIGVATAAGRIYGIGFDGKTLNMTDAPFLQQTIHNLLTTDVTGDGRDEIVAVSSHGEATAVDPRTSTRIWTTDLNGTTTGITLAESIIAFSFDDGRIEALDKTSGAPSWNHTDPAGFGSIAYSPALDLIGAGDDSGKLHLLKRDGTPETTVQTSGTANILDLYPAQLEPGPGFIASVGAGVEAITPDEGSLWRSSVALAVIQLAVGDMTGDGVDEALVNDFTQRTHALDGQDGEALWTRSTGFANGDLAVADLLGTGKGLAMISTPSGANGRFLDVVDENNLRVMNAKPRMEPQKVAIADLDGNGGKKMVLSTTEGDIYTLDTTLPVNLPPALDLDTDLTIPIGQEFTLDVTATDPDEDPITYSASGLPNGAAFDPDTQRFAWTPTMQQVGDHEVTFHASDGTLTASQDVTLIVADIDPPPVLPSIDDVIAAAGTPLSVTIEAHDPSDDVVDLWLDAQPALPPEATFEVQQSSTGTTGTLEWTPMVDDAGEYDVVATAQNSSGQTTQSFKIQVFADPPEVNVRTPFLDGYGISANPAIIDESLQLRASATHGTNNIEAVEFQVVDDEGTTTLQGVHQGGNLWHTAEPYLAHAMGKLTIEVTATDDQGVKGQGARTIQVLPPQPPSPVAPDTKEVDGFEAITLKGKGDHPLGRPLTYQWQLPDGTTTSSKSATFTPEEIGAHEAIFTVTDPSGSSATTTTTILVHDTVELSARFVQTDPDSVGLDERPRISLHVTNDYGETVGDADATITIRHRVTGQVLNTVEATTRASGITLVTLPTDTPVGANLLGEHEVGIDLVAPAHPDSSSQDPHHRQKTMIYTVVSQ